MRTLIELLVELLDLCVHACDCYSEVRSLAVVTVRGVVVGGRVALFIEFRDLQAIVLFLIFQLRNHLTRAHQLFVLIVKSLEAVATDTALFPVKRLGVVQDGRVLGNHV